MNLTQRYLNMRMWRQHCNAFHPISHFLTVNHNTPAPTVCYIVTTRFNTMITCEVIPSHTLALWIMRQIDRMLDAAGIDKSPVIDQILYVMVIVLIGIALGLTVKTAVLFIVRKLVKLRNSKVAREILDEHVLLHCSHVIPPLVILGLIPLALNHSDLSVWLIKILLVYTIIVVTIAICAILSFIWRRYDERENTRNLPLKGILYSIEGIIWLIAGIVAISVLVGKSPTALLAGLGMFATALMLIFKDSILGFTAGIQLALNDMVHVGDWIVVPSTPANGIVRDVSLTAVKIQNFDNTIITCPPYTLVSTSFQNYKGMTDSGCRRIARSIIFDFNSITSLTSERVAEIVSKLPLLGDFAEKAGESPVFNPGTSVVNGTVDTNLGLFRAYMCRYILSRPELSHTSQILVRLMEPNAYGMPVQIYCFTATTAWTAYEAIQSALFEHIAAVAPVFGLVIFNSPSGTDIDQIQVLDADNVTGQLPHTR